MRRSRGDPVEQIKESIRQFILTKYLAGEPAGQLKDDTPLQTSGILDSLGTLELAAHLEEQFAVTLTVADTSAERFDRIVDIASTVAARRRGGQRKAS